MNLSGGGFEKIYRNPGSVSDMRGNQISSCRDDGGLWLTAAQANRDARDRHADHCAAFPVPTTVACNIIVTLPARPRLGSAR